MTGPALGVLKVEAKVARNSTSLPMTDQENGNLTKLLHRAADGDSRAKADLYELIYDYMRVAARRVMRNRKRGDYQTTALVNESLLRFENEVLISFV